MYFCFFPQFALFQIQFYGNLTMKRDAPNGPNLIPTLQELVGFHFVGCESRAKKCGVQDGCADECTNSISPIEIHVTT